MKKIISIIITLIVILSLVIPAYSATKDELAISLKTLGLFKGVSDTDFALDRAPTRIEAIVMLIRTLGKEEEALSIERSHPFTDVPSWADKYIGYAYETGLSKGVSSTSFGNGNASAANYLTFTLRALGYSDAGNEDFSWDNPYSLAKETGILSDEVNTDDFKRGDCVIVSYSALSANLKNSNDTLADKLISENVFTRDNYEKVAENINSTENPIIIIRNNATDTQIDIPSRSFGNDNITNFETSPQLSDEIYNEIQNHASTLSDDMISSLEGKAVFWAPTGEKIHLNPNCTSFKLGIVFAGTLEEARSVRTEGWCGICAKTKSSQKYEKETNNTKATKEELSKCYSYTDFLVLTKKFQIVQ